MKQWGVDNYIIGPAVDAEYDDTADKLAEVLNSYERKGCTIQEIIEVREGFFRIIYTSEDDYEDENICASYRVKKRFFILKQLHKRKIQKDAQCQLRLVIILLKQMIWTQKKALTIV